MPEFLSPGVQSTETELQQVSRSGSVSKIASVVSSMSWGPVDETVIVSDEAELAAIFGPSTNANYKDWLAAAIALKDTKNLTLIRSAESDALNSVLAGAPVLIKNDGVFDADRDTPNVTHIVAKYPGILGDSLRIVVIDQYNYPDVSPSVKSLVPNQPNRTSWAVDHGVKNDELHILIFDGNGSLVETFFGLSKHPNAVNESGETLYYKAVLNKKSNLVRATQPFEGSFLSSSGMYLAGATIDTAGTALVNPVVTVNGIGTGASASVITNTAGAVTSVVIVEPGVGYDVATTLTVTADSGTVATLTPVMAPSASHAIGDATATDFISLDYINDNLTGGSNGSTPTTASRIESWSLYNDKDSVFVYNYYLGASLDDLVVVQYVIDVIANGRSDSVVAIAPPAGTTSGKSQSAAVTAIRNWNTRLNRDSSFITRINTGVIVFDKYANKARNIAGDVVVAAAIARKATTGNYFESPAGLDSGQIKGAIGLEFDAKKTARDELYPLGVNCLTTISGQIVLFGDRTGTRREAPLSYIGSRVLVNVLKTNAVATLQRHIFKQNNSVTRRTVETALQPLVRQLISAGALEQGSAVYCNSLNNPPDVIAQKKLKAAIVIKLFGSVQFIVLDIFASEAGLNVEELIVNNNIFGSSV